MEERTSPRNTGLYAGLLAAILAAAVALLVAPALTPLCALAGVVWVVGWFARAAL